MFRGPGASGRAPCRLASVVRRRFGSSGFASSPGRLGATALLVAFAAGVSFSPSALAYLAVQHDSYVATELPGASDGDGIIGPGDGFSVTENVLSAEPSPLTHV